MGTADDLRPRQRLLPLCSLPQGDQSGHVCGRADGANVERNFKGNKGFVLVQGHDA